MVMSRGVDCVAWLRMPGDNTIPGLSKLRCVPLSVSLSPRVALGANDTLLRAVDMQGVEWGQGGVDGCTVNTRGESRGFKYFSGFSVLLETCSQYSPRLPHLYHPDHPLRVLINSPLLPPPNSSSLRNVTRFEK